MLVVALVPKSKALLAELEQLGPDVKRALVARPHPERRFVALRSRTWAADKALTALVERFGEARWQYGRWHVRRPQLRLPGM